MPARFNRHNMNDQFRRILDLVRRTGDTMVVTDPDGDDVFVVMDLEQYELMLDMAEFSEGSEELETTAESPDVWETMKPAGEDGETWDVSKMNEEELADLEEQYRQFAQRNVKEAIETKETPKNQEKKPDSEDFGEEQFYLEPIE